MAATLKSDDYGGRLDAMERSVQMLEDDMREVKADLKAVLIDTAEIKGTLKGMPTAAAFAELSIKVGELRGAPTAAAFAELSAKVGELKGMPTAAAFAELSTKVGELRGAPTAAAFAELSAKVGELKGMPTAAAFAELKGVVGELKGRVDALPTMAKMNSAIGVATAVIVILNNWSLLKTWLVG